MNDDRRRELREAFIDARGFWTPLWEGLLDLDPDFFEAYLSFSSVPWRNGPLEPKGKELGACPSASSAWGTWAAASRAG